MAQATQIVPKFSFPYVETHINDYTTVTNTDVDYGVMEPVVSYIFPFVSSKGIDNKFIKYHGKASIIKAYGNSNWKKYGQPLMQVLNIANSLNSEIWCMRVMPENATYAHNVVSVHYRGDTADNVTEAHNRRFRIKFVKSPAQTKKVVTDDESATSEEYEDAKIIKPSDLQLARYVNANAGTLDDEGYSIEPGVFTFRSAGRGVYGNNYRVRASQNIAYEKEYGIKFYDFEVLSNENALTKESTYTGSMVVSQKYEATTMINDVLDDTPTGTAPVFLNVDEDGVDNIYAAYVDWFESNKEDLLDEITDLQSVVEGYYNDEDGKFYLISEEESEPVIDVESVVGGKAYVHPVVSGTLTPGGFTVDGETVDGTSDIIYYDTTTEKYYLYDSEATPSFVEQEDTSSLIVTVEADKIYCDTTTSKYYELNTTSNLLVETEYTPVTDTEVEPIKDNKVYYDSVADKYYVYTSLTDGTYAYQTDDSLVSEVTDGMVNGTETYSALVKPLIKLIRSIKTLLTYGVPSVDEFDLLFGRSVAKTTSDQLIAYPQKLTDDVDQTATDFDTNNYTTTENVVYFDSVEGVNLVNGYDGYFTEGEQRTVPTIVDGRTVNVQWTLDQEIEECYKNAFNGTYDKRVLSAKRLKASALWDANYPMSIKNVMADLALCRNDGLCYLDCGIMSNFSLSTVENLITDFAGFDDHKISKNIHHYYTREANTKKRVPVTITYFLSRKFADHVVNNGSHIPFVKSYAQLDNFIKDTMYPTIEDYETEIKEKLIDNRFNYFDVVDDGVYERATQNTSQSSTSDLLEENNVHTLYEIKRIVEADITRNLYDFSDQQTRQNFRDFEIAKFENWSSRQVQSFDIQFGMNAWESERSILHAYISVVFRGLQKRAILEIDINKRTYNEDESITTDSFSYTY